MQKRKRMATLFIMLMTSMSVLTACADSAADTAGDTNEVKTTAAIDLDAGTTKAPVKPQEERTEELEPTKESESVLTEEYELICEGMHVFRSGTTGSYFKYKDMYADLYMRKLQADTGEHIELSLWSGQKEIWHTGNCDSTSGDYAGDSPFWLADYSTHVFWRKGCVIM